MLTTLTARSLEGKSAPEAHRAVVLDQTNILMAHLLQVNGPATHRWLTCGNQVVVVAALHHEKVPPWHFIPDICAHLLSNEAPAGTLSLSCCGCAAANAVCHHPICCPGCAAVAASAATQQKTQMQPSSCYLGHVNWCIWYGCSWYAQGALALAMVILQLLARPFFCRRQVSLRHFTLTHHHRGSSITVHEL